MAKKVILKYLVLRADENGDFTKGAVAYKLKIGGALRPQTHTMGTVGWFESADLKKILKKAKEKIEEGINNKNP